MDEPKSILATFNAYDMSEVVNYAHLHDYMGALEEIEELLRHWNKYGHKFTTADEVIDHLRDFIGELRLERNIIIV